MSDQTVSPANLGGYMKAERHRQRSEPGSANA